MEFKMTVARIAAAAGLALGLGLAGTALAHSDQDGDHHRPSQHHHDRGQGDDHHKDGHHAHDQHRGHDSHGHHDHHHHMSFGQPGDPKQVNRTIAIVATDNDFDHKTIRISSGETIRFVLKNKGELLHEFTIGTTEMQKAHQREMAKMMERGDISVDGISGKAHHSHPNSVLIEPGKTKEIIWKFAKARDLEFGCNIPGHYEAGMHGRFSFGVASSTR